MRDIATQVFATHRQVLSGVHLGRSRFRVDEDARGKSGGGRHGDQCQNGCHVGAEQISDPRGTPDLRARSKYE